VMFVADELQDCLRNMVIPAMQRVQDKVNFTLSFIGKPTKNDGVECMHGPNECASCQLTHPSCCSELTGDLDRYGQHH
jgi:hypothetical protein